MQSTDARLAADRWLAALADAARGRTIDVAGSLFGEPCYWRDILAARFRIDTYSGVEIPPLLDAWLTRIDPSSLMVAPNRTSPRTVVRGGVQAVEAFFDFAGTHGRGTGVVRLVPGGRPDLPWRAWNLLTTLQSLDGCPELTGPHRRRLPDADALGGESWLERRQRRSAFADREPEVVVVGAGQSGLSAAACLGALGADVLVIEREARLGDSWRNRYRGLTLHNPVWVNDLPYLSYPQTWPTYVPKDLLADWFESYANALQLTVWPRTALSSGCYDDRTGRWTISVRRDDGSARDIAPRHVVLATGVSDIPLIPPLPGLEDFAGRVIHSSGYAAEAIDPGARVLVVGTGNSAHDIAQDLHSRGVGVTMMQRGSTTVASVEPSGILTARLYSEDMPVADCDLIAASIPYPVEIDDARTITSRMRELDGELLAGLERIGFRLDFGHDGTGHALKYKRQRGGYYLNVGCSDLLIAGEIGLIHHDDVTRFAERGAILRSGQTVPCDVIILATGFAGQQESARAPFGSDVADAVGPVWGYDGRGELRNVWKATAQPGLWFAAGNFQQCRVYARFLAMQIVAQLRGLVPPVGLEDESSMARSD
jgi:cation diffusion facilitator CzcD-associated flavoprotein CzcO